MWNNPRISVQLLRIYINRTEFVLIMLSMQQQKDTWRWLNEDVLMKVWSMAVIL